MKPDKLKVHTKEEADPGDSKGDCRGSQKPYSITTENNVIRL